MSRLVCFFIGLIIGGALSVELLFLLLTYSTQQKEPPTKDDWRMP